MEEKIYETVSREGEWIEELIVSHNSALELIRKLKKSQEILQRNQRAETTNSGKSSRTGFDEDETFKWIKSRSRFFVHFEHKNSKLLGFITITW